jgi:two-component system sensor histidine kinase/response regulator
MNIKGTGLGLSICKKIIEQLGGSVTVISKVGVGSNFVISLDLEAQENLETNELEI